MLINGVTFAEQAGESKKSPSFRFAPEAAQSQRSLFLPYVDDVSEVFEASKALLGYSYLDSDNLGPGGSIRRFIRRVPPAALPAFVTEVNPDLIPYLHCTSVPLVEPYSAPGPAGPTEGLSNYKWWKFSTVWETLGYDVLVDDDVLAQAGPLFLVPSRPDEGDALRRGIALTRWITRAVDPGSHAQTLRSHGRFAGFEGLDDAPIPEGYTTTVARMVVHYTHHCIPSYDALPFSAIQKALGTTNNATFDTMTPGTAMLSDAKIRQYKDSFGQRVFDTTYTMIFRPLIDSVTGFNWGWHGLYRVVAGKLRVWPISADGAIPDAANPAGTALKEYSDFSALFRPPQG